MPYNPGSLRSRLNERFGSVIRFANAEWNATGLNTGTRYELFGWDEYEGSYFVFDNVENILINLERLFGGLSQSRQRAILSRQGR